VLPAAFGAVVFLVYLPGAGRSLDFDSSQTVGAYVRTPSVLDAIASQRLFNNHPAFSLIEHVVATMTGSTEEWVLRIAPIAFAAVAVGVLVGALQRRVGTLAAVAAGLFMATNPTVLQLSRSVRGYSLLLLCSIASSALLADLLGPEPDERRHRRRRIAYIATIAVGTATHLYMVPVVLAHVVVVAARRRLDSEWGLRWVAGLGLGACIYAAMLPDLLDAASAGGRTFKPGFPLRLAEVVTGTGWAIPFTGAVVVIGAALVLARRSDLRLATAAVTAAVAFTWLVTASVHLEARFHVWLVPAAAAVVAVAVRRRPALLALVLIGAAINTWSVLDGYVDDPNAEPELAAVLDHAAAAGERGCVTNYSVLPILGYTSHFAPVLTPADLARCDVVAIPFSNLDHELEAAARAMFPAEGRYDADYEDGFVFARDPDFFERLCATDQPDLCPP
jgi:hypothetical protein